ncbi:MAG: molecular chaperone [Coriobacteriales bacterium]
MTEHEMDPQEWELLAQSANYNRFLARLFYEELTDELIEELDCALKVIPLDDDLDELEREFALGTNKMAKFIEHRNPDTKTRSKVDYANIFLGCGSSQDDPVSPFESVYTSEEHLLMQESRDDIYKILRAEGLVIDDHYNMPEDHIAFELQYLGLVEERACRLHADGDEEAAAAELAKRDGFFRAHIANWVPQLCADAGSIAKTPFYQGLAQATAAWVAMQAQELAAREA